MRVQPKDYANASRVTRVASFERRDDARRGSSIAVRIDVAGERRTCVRVVEKQMHRRGDGVAVRADEHGGARVDGLGTLGDLAHHEHGLAERGRFFLHAAGIGQHERRTLKEPHEAEIVLRLDEMHVGRAAERADHRCTYVRIQMDRIDDLHVATLREAHQRRADIAQAAAETLAPMAGDENQMLRWIEKRKARIERAAQCVLRIDALRDGVQRIDHRVAGDERASVQRFLHEIRMRTRGRDEHHVAYDIDEAPVHFFRPRAAHVAGAQARFDVRDRHLPVKRGERASRRGGRVAMHEHAIRPLLRDDVIDRRNEARSQPVQGLVLRHDREIVMRRDVEQIQHLLQHRAMLAGHTHDGTNTGFRFQRLYEGRHLDGFGPRSKNGKYRFSLRVH
jgi:hypothetical protein